MASYVEHNYNYNIEPACQDRYLVLQLAIGTFAPMMCSETIIQVSYTNQYDVCDIVRPGIEPLYSP